MDISRSVPLILVLCLLVAGVSATTDDLNLIPDTSEYNFVAPDNYVIYEIDIGALPMGANQTHSLVYDGTTFTLEIGSVQSYVIYHTFDVTLTYPDGSVETTRKTTTRISGGSYQTKIQPVFTQSESGYNAYVTVNLEVGLSPLKAAVGTAGLSESEWDPSTAIPFTSASGTLGSATDVSLYTISSEDFENWIRNYDPWYNASSLLDDIFEWAWSGILAFLNAIPVIGPLAVTFLTYAGSILSVLIFWLGFIVNNFPAIVLTVETVIMFAALINSRNTLQSLLKNWLNYNISAIKGLLWFLDLVRGWVVSLVQMFADIVHSLH